AAGAEAEVAGEAEVERARQGGDRGVGREDRGPARRRDGRADRVAPHHPRVPGGAETIQQGDEVIRFQKPTTPPGILTGRGATAAADLKSAHNKGKRDFAEGDFDKSIYGHREVKAALRQAQRDKCAFCESSVSHVSYGDVEHY